MKIIHTARNFMNKLGRDNISAFSAQASFFIFISLFPFLILLLTMIQYTPVTKALLLQIAVKIVPANVTPLIITILDEMYNKSSTTLISLSAISAVWSAGKGFFAIIKGLNSAMEIKETRNYLVLRLVSGLYTLVFLVILIISLTLIVYGNKLHAFITKSFPFLASVTAGLINIRGILVFAILVLFFIFLYKFIPNRKTSLVRELPGAIFASAGWLIFSYVYSLYVDRFSSLSYMYGSLTTIIVSLLWLYFIMYIMFIGAEINAFLHVMIPNKQI